MSHATAVHAVSTAALLADLSCDIETSVHNFDGVYGRVPPFCVRFCPQADRTHLAAVADEEGLVSLFETDKTRIPTASAQRLLVWSGPLGAW